MKSQKQMALYGLAGGVALASAAFAIGSQAGGGSAVAGTSPAPAAATTTSAFAKAQAATGPERRGTTRHEHQEVLLADVARKLGVSENALRAAMEDLRPGRDGEDHADFATDLAKLLGLDAAKVQAALGKTGPGPGERHRHHGGPPEEIVAELAEDLKLDPAKVRAAFDAVRPPEPPRRGERPDKDDFLAALAKELGVDAADVRRSLEDVRPPGHGRKERHGPGGPRGPFADDLAKELGVSGDKLEQAFDTLMQRRQAAFAKALAARLSISPDKVEEVLRELPHPGGRGHHR